VRALTDAGGAVVQTYRTDEFGVPTLVEGTSAQPFQYTGEQRDQETGLVYLRADRDNPFPAARERLGVSSRRIVGIPGVVERRV
jgi:hypothetical protein